MRHRTIITSMLAASTVIALGACTERRQTIGEGARHDSAAFQGVQPTTFTAPGWTPGDRASWEQELKTRLQMGQNEYNKVN